MYVIHTCITHHSHPAITFIISAVAATIIIITITSATIYLGTRSLLLLCFLTQAHSSKSLSVQHLPRHHGLLVNLPLNMEKTPSKLYHSTLYHLLKADQSHFGLAWEASLTKAVLCFYC